MPWVRGRRRSAPRWPSPKPDLHRCPTPAAHPRPFTLSARLARSFRSKSAVIRTANLRTSGLCCAGTSGLCCAGTSIWCSIHGSRITDARRWAHAAALFPRGDQLSKERGGRAGRTTGTIGTFDPTLPTRTIGTTRPRPDRHGSDATINTISISFALLFIEANDM